MLKPDMILAKEFQIGTNDHVSSYHHIVAQPDHQINLLFLRKYWNASMQYAQAYRPTILQTKPIRFFVIFVALSFDDS